VVVDSKGRPLSFAVTGGQDHDSQVGEEILTTPRSPLAITANKAYDSASVRQQINDEGTVPIIPLHRSEENLLSQALLPTTAQNRELFSVISKTEAHCYPI
jgi:hypothetical protein